jgi:sugar phosphate isomerase/epimerase
MKIAFSTVGCPDLNAEQVAEAASKWGYQGVEMRVSPAEGTGAAGVASDPMRSEPRRLREIFDDAGVEILSIATGVRFDKSVWPPVVGRLFWNEEEGVSDTKAAVEQAAACGAEYVRVFGHQLPGGEPRAWGLRRVADRLALAAQTARNTRVRVLIENSGSFSRADELAELAGLVGSQFLGTAYNIVPAVLAGEDPVAAVAALRDGLKVVKVGDVGEDGRPVPLGMGRMPVERFVRALRDMDYQGWIVYEYPRLWRPELTDSDRVLDEAVVRLFSWAGATAAAV